MTNASKPTLPMEIIEAVIWRIPDVATLYSLLTVHRSLFKATVRRLYFNPLEMVVQTRDWGRSLRLLVAVPGACGHAGKSEYYMSKHPPIPEDQLRAVTTMDYFSFMRELAFPPMITDSQFCNGQGPKEMAELLGSSQATDSEAMPALYHLAILWNLAMGRLAQLVKIQIPMWGTVPYLMAVSRMTNVRSIVFDERFETVPGLQDVLAMSDRVLMFCTSFEAYHGAGKLQKIEFFGGSSSSISQDEMARRRAVEDYMLGQVQAPPAAAAASAAASATPRLISELNLHRLKEAEQMGRGWDLTRVKAILLDRTTVLGQSATTMSPIIHPGELLQRCRGLNQLRCAIDRNDAFTWAVQEANEAQTSAVQRALLMDLQKADLACPQDVLPMILDDVLTGFGRSLHDLSLCAMSPDTLGVTGKATKTALGANWDLARVQRLTIQGSPTFDFHAEAFKHCPSLETLEVSLTTRDKYDSALLQPQPIWSTMPHLRVLTLDGMLALKFHPESLRHMPQLEELILGGNVRLTDHNQIYNNRPHRNVRGSPVMPGKPGPLPFSPRWTWDWSMPKLRELSLRGAFAAMIDFKWLSHCPNLEALLLDNAEIGIALNFFPLLQSYLLEETFYRVAGLESLGGRRFGKDSSGSSAKLRVICISGRWHIGEDDIRRIVTSVAPNLVCLVLSGCFGYDTSNLVQIAEEHAYLRHVSADDSVDRDEAKELGLLRIRNDDDDEDEEEEKEEEGKEDVVIDEEDKMDPELHFLSGPQSLPTKDESAALSRFGYKARDGHCRYKFENDIYYSSRRRTAL
ncbi:hypothetical protein DFQ26_003765 [Actinomortierella ambigua]|nr:hypothetical protein DFQ26_003765 [Actinomortierella ambigua]